MLENSRHKKDLQMPSIKTTLIKDLHQEELWSRNEDSFKRKGFLLCIQKLIEVAKALPLNLLQICGLHILTLINSLL